MRTFTILGVSLLLSACTASTLSEHGYDSKSLMTDSLLLQNLSAKTIALNLPPIDKGVDSFELRVWHGLSIVTPNQLVTLRYHDSAWHLTNTDYWFTYQWINGSPNKVRLDSSFTKTLKVPPNISSIVDSINHFRLDTFPTQTEIPGFLDKIADGIFYQIEIATPNFHRAIRYNNPSHYDDAYNQQMTKFIRTLNQIGVFSMP